MAEAVGAESGEQGASIKVAVVGDPEVGKSSLLAAFRDKGKPVPALHAPFAWPATVAGRTVEISLWDTPGSGPAEQRLAAYQHCDLVLLCFAIDQRSSYTAIAEKWLPEVQQHCPNAVWMVVATKADLRKVLFSERLVTSEEGEMLYVKVNANEYFESSATVRKSVRSILTSAVNLSLQLFATEAAKYLSAPGDAHLATPIWAADRDVHQCQKCSSNFTTFRRRHHCRNCGNIFCDSCTSHRTTIPVFGYYAPVRVCDGCFDNQSSPSRSNRGTDAAAASPPEES